MYVLDTNTLIYYFKGQGQVAANFAKIPNQEILQQFEIKPATRMVKL